MKVVFIGIFVFLSIFIKKVCKILHCVQLGCALLFDYDYQEVRISHTNQY